MSEEVKKGDNSMNVIETGQIILFPDYEVLKKEVEKLRTELSMLVLEKDELVLVEAKNLEMKYMLEIGATEYKAFEAQCAMLRLKRKVGLIQAKKNRQEKVIMADIEKIRSSYPFTVMQLLIDPEKIKEKKQELEEIIKQYMEVIQIYQKRIDEMTGR